MSRFFNKLTLKLFTIDSDLFTYEDTNHPNEYQTTITAFSITRSLNHLLYSITMRFRIFYFERYTVGERYRNTKRLLHFIFIKTYDCLDETKDRDIELAALSLISGTMEENEV